MPDKMDPILRAEDHLYARLPLHQRRVAQAKALLAEAFQRAPRLGVCLSGGKDSVCALHLTLACGQPAAVLFFDSGAEYPETLPFLLELERRWGFTLTIYEPTRTLLEIYRAAGLLGYRGPAYEGLQLKTTDIADILIRDPSRTAIADFQLTGLVLGLRREESDARRLHLARRGALYWSARDQVWMCHPLAHWTARDIWAYAATHDVPLHPVYAKTRFTTRDHIRVAPYAGLTNRTRGRLVWLRYYYPDLFQRFAVEFPEVRAYV